VDIGGTLGRAPMPDLVILVGLAVFFFLGVLQGSIRRLLGIAALLFAFVVAASAREPVGGFLAGNWTQFNHEYNRLLAFLIVFVALVVILTIVIQSTYKRVEISARRPIVDDAVGALLGVVEGVLLLLFLVIILNSYHPPAGSGTLSELSQVQNALVNESGIADWMQSAVAPLFVHLFGLLLPSDLVKLYN
jgi:uncharacterized membrane protein required for colicin V production